MGDSAHASFDVLVVGGGPAGVAAASIASECGARVGLVDDNFALGGQIWRGGRPSEHGAGASAWSDRLGRTSARMLFGTRVFHAPKPGLLLAEGTDVVVELRYSNLILATGARERFLPFPGWTLPNVMGAGGLQAMVKSGLPIRGKRVVIAGTGPLLLAVAAYLRKQGADILIVCEQATRASMARFAMSLSSFPEKILQAWSLKKDLAGTRFAANSWAIAAHGKSALESVTLSHGGKLETFACDYLAVGFHLVPNVELAAVLGCKTSNGHVEVNDLQETTVPRVFCAGEPTGIGGLESALVEGQIAGFAAGGETKKARELFKERERTKRFTRLLDQTFRLRPELKSLAAADTIVCRCEDVQYARLQHRTCWRSAKLQTRCGMGPCQGRICGPATEFLFGWTPDSVRPPIFPAKVDSLADFNVSTEEVQAGSGGRK
jgi:NADPH-dependent 2,4-dienoyl-CoA reductase/sulfur reductase-like enzyme